MDNEMRMVQMNAYDSLCWHPLYDQAKKELEDVLVMKEEVLTYYKEFDEKLRLADLYGKTVLVSDTQFPEIYVMEKKIAAQFEERIIPLYVYEDFYYGIEAKGTTVPWIEISAKTIADLDKKEIEFLLARQFFIIHSGAMELEAIASQSFSALDASGLLLGSDTAAKTLQVKHAFWSRLLNYSADRFAYLWVQDMKCCVDAILILILNNVELARKVNLKEYLKQSEKINALDDAVSQFTKADEKIPYGPFRIKNLFEFATSKDVLAYLEEDGK